MPIHSFEITHNNQTSSQLRVIQLILPLSLVKTNRTLTKSYIFLVYQDTLDIEMEMDIVTRDGCLFDASVF